jgi:hypothetical protein
MNEIEIENFWCGRDFMKPLRLVAAGLLALSTTSYALAEDDATAAKRQIYALAVAGAEFCPNLENPMFALGAIGYRITDEEGPAYLAERQKWFDVFRSIGNRDLVCETLANEYGPGAKIQLFQFK